MVVTWALPLSCFTTGAIENIECFLGNGLGSFVGNPIYATLILLLAGVLICWKMRLPLDLSAIFILALVMAGNIAFVPDWIKWVIILALAILTGFGANKFLHRA